MSSVLKHRQVGDHISYMLVGRIPTHRTDTLLLIDDMAQQRIREIGNDLIRLFEKYGIGQSFDASIPLAGLVHILMVEYASLRDDVSPKEGPERNGWGF